jgi:Cys-tRNA(Pro) deacylase
MFEIASDGLEALTIIDRLVDFHPSAYTHDRIDSMTLDNPVTQDLDQLGVSYQLHLHSGEVRSLEQAAAEREMKPEQIIRTLVFRLEDESYVVVLMPGRKRVSWPKLRRYLGVSRIRTAREEEVEKVTGYLPGAVSPFGLPQPLRIFADRDIANNAVISIGAGIRNAGVKLASEDLLLTLKPEMGDFGE